MPSLKIKSTVVKFEIILGLTLFFTAQCVSAQGAISQSYSTTSTAITPGALVSLSAATNDVVLSDPSNASTLVGIAISQPLVQLSSSKQNAVQVAVSGTTDVLVSNANGPIVTGDKITISPLQGIGMKATNAGEIVGTAQASLQSVKTVPRLVNEVSGKQDTLAVGLIPVTINVTYYTAGSQGAVASVIPPFLQSIANSLTGKQVSALRVLFATIALLFGFISVILMLYVAIRSGVISIGRNPLAEASLRKGLVDVIVAAVGVLAITGIIIYIILFG